MKIALIVTIIFGIATVALFLAPGFVFRGKTIGIHEVDLSKSGETVLPIADVTFCCGSKLLLFLDSPVKFDRNNVARELLKSSNVVCEILLPAGETALTVINSNPSWSGLGTTKRMIFLGYARPRHGQGRSARLKIADGCAMLSGVKQTIVLRQTPCAMNVAYGAIPFLLGAVVTGGIAAIALIVALVKAVKMKRLRKKESNKTLQQTATND